MTTSDTAPVRIPNVRPGALSGLDNEPLVAQSDAADLSGDLASPSLPTIPEDKVTVPDLLGWVNEPEGDADSDHDEVTRALAVLVAERQRDEQRVTLVEPLERKVLDAILDEFTPEVQDGDEGGQDGDEGGQGSGGGDGPPDGSQGVVGSAEVVTTAAGEGITIEGQTVETQTQPGADADGFGGDAPQPAVTVPDGLTGEALDAWVSGDAVEGDETENPERHAAYLARLQAARDAGHVTGPDDAD